MMPFPTIPSDAVPFYVSDSYSLDIHPGNPWNYWPGPFNSTGTIPAGSSADIWFTGGEFCLIAPQQTQTLFNVDIRIGLYDVSVSPPVLVPPGFLAAFVPPYGASVALLMNSATGHDRSSETRHHHIDAPIKCRLATPGSGGPFKPGGRISFFSGLTSPMRCHYAYWMQGAWKIAEV